MYVCVCVCVSVCVCVCVNVYLALCQYICIKTAVVSICMDALLGR